MLAHLPEIDELYYCHLDNPIQYRIFQCSYAWLMGDALTIGTTIQCDNRASDVQSRKTSAYSGFLVGCGTLTR